jgi:hypothetical protein
MIRSPQAAGHEGISLYLNGVSADRIRRQFRVLPVYITLDEDWDGAMSLVASPELACTSMETLLDNISGARFHLQSYRPCAGLLVVLLLDFPSLPPSITHMSPFLAVKHFLWLHQRVGANTDTPTSRNQKDFERQTSRQICF